MARQQSITFANLICRFGKRFVLLDFAEEIILPAFFDTRLRRSYGATTYSFLNVGWSRVSPGETHEEELLIYGQLVKDTTLTREQVLVAGHLVEDRESMPSAPSAFFVFLFSNHKLILMPETAAAPTLEIFASTFEYFVRAKRNAFLDAIYEFRQNTEQPVTKGVLYDSLPAPQIEALPLASRGSIEAFVASIDKLTHLEFRILDTNKETQFLGPYQEIRETKRALNARTTKLSYDSPGGLEKAEAASQIEISAASGNQAVRVAGRGRNGSQVSGDNEGFRLHVPITEIPREPKRRAFALLEKFRAQAESGTISLDQATDTRAEISRLSNALQADGTGPVVGASRAGPLFQSSTETDRLTKETARLLGEER